MKAMQTLIMIVVFVTVLIIWQKTPNASAESDSSQQNTTTEFKLLIKPDGKVGEITIISSCGRPDCDRAAIAVVKEWKFSPVVIDGVAVEKWVPVTIKLSVLDGIRRPFNQH